MKLPIPDLPVNIILNHNGYIVCGLGPTPIGPYPREEKAKSVIESVLLNDYAYKRDHAALLARNAPLRRQRDNPDDPVIKMIVEEVRQTNSPKNGADGSRPSLRIDRKRLAREPQPW